MSRLQPKNKDLVPVNGKHYISFEICEPCSFILVGIVMLNIVTLKGINNEIFYYLVGKIFENHI